MLIAPVAHKPKMVVYTSIWAGLFSLLLDGVNVGNGGGEGSLSLGRGRKLLVITNPSVGKVLPCLFTMEISSDDNRYNL